MIRGLPVRACLRVFLSVLLFTGICSAQVTASISVLTTDASVTAEAPVVNTTTLPTSGLVSEREVKDLPLNGRSYDNLITLNAGTANYTSMRTSASNGNLFSVSGRRLEQNLFLLNGVEWGGN